MPLRTRKFKKYIKKRKYRRYYKKYKVNKPMGLVHKFIRVADYDTISSSAVADQFGAFSYSLVLLPDYAEFTNLFDEYMIYKVTMRFLPLGVDSVNSTTLVKPLFYLMIDKDDDATPSSVNQFYENPTTRYSIAGKQHKISLYPMFSRAVYQSALATGYGTGRGFLDCSNASIPHYGVKWYLGPSVIANACTYKIIVKYYIRCRGVR